MTATTAFRASVDYLTARHGRLHNKRAWCPNTKDSEDWLQVDLGTAYFVCGVVTQGKEMRVNEWVYNYTITWSVDGVTWRNASSSYGLLPQVFQGNKDGSSEVQNKFYGKLWSRYLRFHPLSYEEWPCLRVEILVDLIAPVIQTKSLPRTLVFGQTLLLDCEAKGSPQPEVKWMLNGNDIIFGKVLANGSLKVEKVENDDNFEGTYTCRASNRVSTARSSTQVTIHEGPQILTPLTRSTAVLRGKSAVLTCYATGDPMPRIAWSKKDGTIPPERIRSNNHVLLIPHATSRDAGTYSCIATNYIKEVTSETNLTIIDVPNINTDLTRQSITAERGQTVNIGCYGDSLLPLNYSWTKDGQPITGREKGERVYGNILVITPRRDKDYGTYVCHVTNDVDTASFSIELSPFNCDCAVSSALKSSPCASGQLEIILPLLFLIFLSMAVNFYLIYRLCRARQSCSVPVRMSSLPEHGELEPGSHTAKDTDIAWDNLVSGELYREGNRDLRDVNLDDEEIDRFHEDDQVHLVGPRSPRPGS
ncbi:predicted protein [Nematostella vectensis]|uniref:Uncharacterized protein n=1 Tax=Nematostella vectensis TaxID=45351 RepID=A7RTW2_NEMVE|nr:predicted protein [Nematostella vectensis]|eukprot:XP_001637163.1 predicted protein [Nematostella vectensis]